MSVVILKTAKRPTSVPRSKIRKAVAAAYAKKAETSQTQVAVVRVSKKASPKAVRAQGK
jgi:hypothetical protein